MKSLIIELDKKSSLEVNNLTIDEMLVCVCMILDFVIKKDGISKYTVLAVIDNALDAKLELDQKFMQ